MCKLKQKQIGTLYGVGVGPGDPELLTLKALRIIQNVQVIATPSAKNDGKSYALDIIRDRLKKEQQIVFLHFSMVKDLAVRQAHRQAAGKKVLSYLEQGKDVAFITEGDPLFYSTFTCLLDYLPDNVPIEVVPGVDSIHAATADIRRPLVRADQKLAILPISTTTLLKLPTVLLLFETVVLLKINRHLGRLVMMLDELNMLEHTVLIERASNQSTRIIRNLQEGNLDVHYLSQMIIYNNGRNTETD